MKKVIGYVLLLIIIIILVFLYINKKPESCKCKNDTCSCNCNNPATKYICTINEVDIPTIYSSVINKEIITFNTEGLVTSYVVGEEYKFNNVDDFNREFNSELSQTRSYEKTGDLSFYDKQEINVSEDAMWIKDIINEKQEQGYTCTKEM